MTPEEDDVAPETSTEEETRRQPSRITAQVARDRLLAELISLKGFIGTASFFLVLESTCRELLVVQVLPG